LYPQSLKIETIAVSQIVLTKKRRIEKYEKYEKYKKIQNTKTGKWKKMT